MTFRWAKRIDNFFVIPTIIPDEKRFFVRSLNVEMEIAKKTKKLVKAWDSEDEIAKFHPPIIIIIIIYNWN